MAEHDCSKHNSLLKRIGLIFCFIPWCCVSVLIITLCSAFGITVGFAFDNWFHKIIPALVLVHGYNLFKYLRNPHKTRKHNLIVILMTTIFAASILFHLTDLHDVLTGN